MRHNQVVVAIPARNEVESVGDCIRSVDSAAAEVPVPVLVVVAADSCTDGTEDAVADVSTTFCSVALIAGNWGRAGAARAAAVHHALDALPFATGPVWIANTDADCVVPPTWLRTQLDLAKDLDAVAGIVALDPTVTSPAVFEAFTAAYHLDGDEHRHVHGANIGVCATAYLAVGGWCSKTVVGEDHVMWNALRQNGQRVRQATSLHVLTSARTRSRVVGGFATNLAMIEPDELLVAATP